MLSMKYAQIYINNLINMHKLCGNAIDIFFFSIFNSFLHLTQPTNWKVGKIAW